jgi:hypothetical protein
MATRIFVPLGTIILLTSVPSLPMIDFVRGIVVSLLALDDASRSYQQNLGEEWLTLTLSRRLERVGN